MFPGSRTSDILYFTRFREANCRTLPFFVYDSLNLFFDSSHVLVGGCYVYSSHKISVIFTFSFGSLSCFRCLFRGLMGGLFADWLAGRLADGL